MSFLVWIMYIDVSAVLGCESMAISLGYVGLCTWWVQMNHEGIIKKRCCHRKIAQLLGCVVWGAMKLDRCLGWTVDAN